MEWGAPPSPVKVLPPPATPPPLVRLKLQLGLETARADASERALRHLAPLLREMGVDVPDTFAHLLR